MCLGICFSVGENVIEGGCLASMLSGFLKPFICFQNLHFLVTLLLVLVILFYIFWIFYRFPVFLLRDLGMFSETFATVWFMESPREIVTVPTLLLTKAMKKIWNASWPFSKLVYLKATQMNTFPRKIKFFIRGIWHWHIIQ